jgi:pimeloyl-ACP methyl ester carboxylesterase/GNAT superfamily N-acetyltransferase
MSDEIRVVPANAAPWDDLARVFGSRGAASACFCQRSKLHPGEAFSKFPAAERAQRLREQTNAGRQAAAHTTGLVAYLGDEPVGWCAVEPRTDLLGLRRVYRVPWEGRDEDRDDPTVWSVTCVLVRSGYRGRGIAYALARAAVEHARTRGARAVEAYPMRREIGEVTWDEIHVGAESVFAAAGMAEVTRPGKRRVVMRADFHPSGPSIDTDPRKHTGSTMNDRSTAAPIILVPGFWLGAWAWDEVAAILRADGHDVTALTLPGFEARETDRSSITTEDHVNAICDAVRAADAPVVLAVHSAAGFSGYAASDRVPERIAAMVYVDTAPGKGALGTDFEGDERPMDWDEVSAEENLDGLSEEQLATFRERALPVPGGVLREAIELTNDARRDIPSTFICTGFSAEQYRTAAREHPEWPFLAGLPEIRHATWIDLPTSHWPMWSRPQDVARIIGEVATAHAPAGGHE